MSERRRAWPCAPSEAETEWIQGVLESSDKPFNALDPLCGSGSVLYECGLKGWRCTGMEGDPFMRWIAMARSFRYRPDAAEFAGYAWERVADDVFWEPDAYTVPEVSGVMSFGPLKNDFLRRVRRQIDKESDEGINNILRMTICDALPALAGGDEGFDDRAGMDLLGDSLLKIKTGLEPNPEVSQTVHLCDSRDIPCPLRNSYDLVVSVLPMIGESPDAQLRRTMCQWIGYDDLVRRDDMCIGYPLGGFDRYMDMYVPDNSCVIRDMLPAVEHQDYLVRWFEDVRDVVISLKSVMSSKCRASFLCPDEVFEGSSVYKAEVIASLAEMEGFEVSTEGTGERRCVVFEKRPQ